METSSGVASFIPWSWIWRRGVVLLLVGVVVFSLFFSDQQTIKDPMPVASRQIEGAIESTSSEDQETVESTPQRLTFFPTPFLCSEPPPCPPCPPGHPPSDTTKPREDLLTSETAAVKSDNTLLSVGYRRRLADTIADVQRQIARVAGHQAVVDSKWALTLGALVEELDPRRGSQTNYTQDPSSELFFETSSKPQLNQTKHVCPEVYMGKKYDHPFYQHGMEMENCSSVPEFNQVLSAVLPAQSWPASTVSFVVSKLRDIYNIPIITLVSNKTSFRFKDKNIKILMARQNFSEATLLNGLVKITKTPYVFIGTSLTHFSNQSSLERLVRILDDVENVRVVGGAARDLQGRWIHGCLQQEMANYKATYKTGYYHSNYECMFCDDLLGPFVTTKKLISRIPFTEGLHGPALFRDWFAKVREAGHLAMTCPDVMFFVDNHVTMNRQDWQMMASQWMLEDIESYTGETFSFSCESVNIKCDNVRSITKSLLLPPCCIARAHKDIGFLIDYANSHGLEYELQAGSALGAVKFGSFLPWDMDHDIFVSCKDFKTWIREFSIFSKTYNCTPKVKYRNTFLKILCHSFTLDIFCRKKMSTTFLPEEYHGIPTTILYGGQWTKVMSNPGLFARNSIGHGIFKHLQHSTHLMEVEKSLGHVKPGTWLPCKTPNHHSCLDRFPADGNLPFIR